MGKPAHRQPVIRCATYTRKSSEEGLEQDFNSLDAQREACEAYILSQKHEGWVCLPEMYDDGGISGATMERPALKRLLSDIGAGRIDTVVAYKVDRLTRSLGDFAKLVEVLDRAGAPFVPGPPDWTLDGDKHSDRLIPLRDDLGPAPYAKHVGHWLDAGARIIGGCCGTSPDHIAKLRELIH